METTTEVKEDVKNSVESNTQNHQAGETASTTKGETVDKDVYEKVQEDMWDERKRRQALQAQLKEFQEIKPQVDDDVEKDPRITAIEARTDVLDKLISEPDFINRKRMVIEEMKITEKTLEEADDTIKARLYDRKILEQPIENNNIPKQLKNSATQEQVDFQKTGDVIKDLKTDPNMPIELRNSMMRKFGK